MNFRIDEVMMAILEDGRLGPFWLVIAILILGYVCVAPLLRSVVVAVVLLICTQVWYAPFFVLARHLRWYVLGILCVRGLAMMMRSEGQPGESRTAHRYVALLAIMALASSLWADNTRYAVTLAASFAIGMLLTFGVLWRLLDHSDVMSAFARAVTVLALVIFSAGFIVAGIADLTESLPFIHATGFDLSRSQSRYSGVFYNANMAGILGATTLPIVLATPREYLGGVARIRVITVILIVVTIYLSGSRSAVLGALFAGVVLALYRYGAGAFVTISMGAVCLGALLVYAPVEELDETSVGHITRISRLPTLSGRFELWQHGWDAAQDTLLFGRGWAENRVLEGANYTKEDALAKGGVVLGSNLHNAHLQLLVDLGLVGVLLFWGFCWSVMRAGWQILRGVHTPRTALTVVIFASVVAMMADTVVHGWVFSTGSPSTLVFWGFCAMVLKETDRMRRELPEGADGDGEPAFPGAWSPAAAAASG